jgi:hypothetical protein
MQRVCQGIFVSKNNRLLKVWGAATPARLAELTIHPAKISAPKGVWQDSVNHPDRSVPNGK